MVGDTHGQMHDVVNMYAGLLCTVRVCFVGKAWELQMNATCRLQRAGEPSESSYYIFNGALLYADAPLELHCLPTFFHQQFWSLQETLWTVELGVWKSSLS